MPDEVATHILQDVAAGWQTVHEALAPLADTDLEQPTVAGWPAKEMLAHLAFWAEAVEGYVTSVIRAQPLAAGWAFGSGYAPDPAKPWPHFEEHNAREAAWGRAHTVREVRARLDQAHAGLMRFLTTVTDAEGQANEQYFRDIAGHYREHAPELRARGSA